MQNTYMKPDEYFDMSETYVSDARTCKKCREMALIRKCVKSSNDLKPVTVILHKMEAEYGDIFRLSHADEISIKAVTSKIIELKVNADTWRIEISPEGYFRTLLHNNYIIEDYNRIMRPGFHVHVKKEHIPFRELVSAMITYRANYHVNRMIQGENVALKHAPENDIGVPRNEELFQVPTAVKLKKFKLLYDRYMYIDTVHDYAREVFAKRGIRAKRIDMVTGSESEFVVVVCDIPKWKRKGMFRVMCEIKSKMFRNGYKDAYMCGITMMRYLEKKGINYRTRFTGR